MVPTARTHAAGGLSWNLKLFFLAFDEWEFRPNQLPQYTTMGVLTQLIISVHHSGVLTPPTPQYATLRGSDPTNPLSTSQWGVLTPPTPSVRHTGGF